MIPLYDDIAEVSDDGIVARIADAIAPPTRVLALTWVHSSTGLKLPVAAISRAVARANAGRDEADHVLFCLDGAHGFGCEDVSFADLGCDFLMAGCHKWLFGPRGTGVVAATTKGLRAIDPVVPTFPTFTDGNVFDAWVSGRNIDAFTTGRTITPGGFKAFEHVWALAEAFDFHEAIGRARVHERTQELASHFKEGLTEIPGVHLETPRSGRLSAGIVSFNIDGWSARNAVRRLEERRIIASVAPYAVPRIRVTPSIVTMDTILAEVAAMAA
jgi:selenocysteine lyase/cysteine desulfurase